jgi:hypothetical protein
MRTKLEELHASIFKEEQHSRLSLKYNYVLLPRSVFPFLHLLTSKSSFYVNITVIYIYGGLLG